MIYKGIRHMDVNSKVTPLLKIEDEFSRIDHDMCM